MTEFTQTFGAFACPGDTIVVEVDGFKAVATLLEEDGPEPPWSREDGRGVVIEGVDRDPRPGERLLSREHNLSCYYDTNATMAKAIKEGWDAEPFGTGTAEERAARAVDADFNYIKAWCDNDWSYVGIGITVSRLGVPLTDSTTNSVWGNELNASGSDNDYLTENANNLLPDALASARKKLAALVASMQPEEPAPGFR